MPIPHFKRYVFRCDNIGGPLIYVAIYNSVTGRQSEHELTPASYRRFVRIANESDLQPEILESTGDFGWSLMRRWTPRGRRCDWPHCNERALPNDIFCESHRQAENSQEGQDVHLDEKREITF